MSDDDNDRPLIRNEDTLVRRAWIDRALSGARGRMKPAELGEAPAATEPAQTADLPAAARPGLYLVRNPGAR